MRLTKLPSRHIGVCLLFATVVCFHVPTSIAQDESISADEQRERLTAERFLQVLLRRPNAGTALDRVFGYHIGRGDVGELVESLKEKAIQSSDADEAGRHWMVIGLLQLQRSEDAAAIEAMSKAEERLPQNPLAAYYHGQALLLVGNTEEASAAMQRAIDLKPPKQDYLKMAGALGRLYQRAGKVDEAIRIWKQLEESFPGDDGVRQRIARIMLEEGDIDGALVRYDALAKDARSDNDRIVFAMRAAELRAQGGKKETAITEFETLLAKLRPGSYLHDEARRRIEATFLASGDYAGLADYYEQWVQSHADDVGAVIRLARTLSVQGRGPEALTWFDRAIERSPNDPEPRLALINAYVAQEKFAEAAAQYEALVELEPNNPDHLVRWGQVLIEDREQPKDTRVESAAAIWQRLAESRADDPVIQSQVADLMRGAELVDAAIERYRSAIRLAPDQPQYKEYLGEYLHRIGRPDEAVVVWRSLVDGDLRNRKNLIRLAEVLNQFDRSDEALEVMAEACQMDPTIEDRLRYGEWLRDAEQYEAALEQIALASDATENFDERERVFAAELKTYQASGQLDVRIESARKLANDAGKDSDLWRQLAILNNAAGRTPEALDAIEKALQNSPDSVDALAVAARMYEDSGRLALAIEKRRRLAETDQRFRTGHLQQLSSLHLRVGETDQAVDVGKELLAASAGSIEAYRFYADLCGKIGRIDQRLDTLRRCARLNPRSNEAQEMLARQLAEDFKTDQAIELYWKMLDGADDMDERRRVVNTLADLYLRTNRLDQLITRLEIRGRESGDRRATVDLIATAHQQAGDLGLAKQALEGLLREDGRDTLLIERLVLLAEQAGEFDEAVALQRQLTRLAPDRKNEARLASLLIDIGEVDEAQAMWLRMTESDTDPAQLARNINRLFAAGETQAAIDLASNSLQQNPDDWETQLQLMILQADEGDWDAASQSADVLVAMNHRDDAFPAGGKPYERTVIRSGGGTYTRPPLRLARLQDMYSFYQIVDERYGSQSTPALPKPIDFGHAKLMATYCQLRQKINSGANIKEHLEAIEKAALAEDATAEQVWRWYEVASLAGMAQQTSSMSAQNPNDWLPLWRLAEVDPDSGGMLLVSMFVSRTSYAQRGDIQLQKLSDDRMQWLKEKTESPDSSVTDQYGRNVSWPAVYGSELRIAGRSDEADKYLQQYLADAISDTDSTDLVAALQQASSYGTDEQLWPLIERALEDQNVLARTFGSSSSVQLLSLFTAEQRVAKELSAGPDDVEFRQRVIRLMDQVLQDESEKPLRRSTIRLTGIGGPRSLGRVVNGQYFRTEIEFPPTGLGPDNSFVFAQHSAWERMKGYSDEWIRSLTSEGGETGSRRLEISRRLAAATLLYWEKRVEEAIAQMEQATKIAAEELPQLEPELRLMSADLLLRQNRKRDALDEIDQLTVYDQQTMAVREFAAARLAAAIGDRDRAQTAARRLFGVRLNTEAQIELAKLMRRLDMRQLAADLVRRMRSQGGSSTDQLQSLMTYFVAQKESEQAAEVAMELLRRSAPTRRANSQYTTTNQVRRRNALQALSTTGRLSSLIKATEEKLEKAPKSQRIRSELAEMYVAAGMTDKSQALLGEMDLDDVNSTKALESTAEQLVAAGKMDEACDAYLKFLRRKQDTFSQNFYEIKRPFDAKQRLGDLADLMIEVGVQKFTDHRVSEICGDLIRDANGIEKARQLYSAMLDLPPTSTNSMYSMSNMMGSASKLLTDRETVMRTANYLVDASIGGNTWNTLFNGYSTSSGGRHNNVTTYFVRHVSADKENAQAVEALLRTKIADNKDWQEGKIWLGLLLTSLEEFDEAKQLLEPLVSKNINPEPTHDLLWLVGSLIDTHEPMQDLAKRMYDYALENTTDRSNRDFQYSLKGRVCNFMAEIGEKARARELALESIEKQQSNPSSYSGNAEYEAYQQIRTTMSMMEFLAEIDYPSDALRVARNFDRSLFVKAGRYQSGRKEQFEKQQQELLDQVRKLGGLETVKSMVDGATKASFAVDFAITLGDRPFTEPINLSLWVALLEEASREKKTADQIAAFVNELQTLAEQRPRDDSAAAGHAIAADVAGDRNALRDLVERWTQTPQAEADSIDQRLRRQLQIVAMLRLDRSVDGDDADEQHQSIAKLAMESIPDIGSLDGTYLLAGLGNQALKRGDTESAKSLWQQIVSLKSNQWLLIDLSHAAINNGMPEISAAGFAAAVEAPAGQIASDDEAVAASGSLGQLLSSAQPRQTSSSSSRQNELDPEEVRLAQRILDLDEAWRVNKLFTKFVFDPLVTLTLGSNGQSRRPLCAPVEIKPGDRIVIHSVFDRLARRSGWSKQTDKLMGYLSGDDAQTQLMAGMTLLYAQRGPEANVRYQAVDTTALGSVPKELVIQSLMMALDDQHCRETAMDLSLALIDQNRPTRRYDNINPFDTLSLLLAKKALQYRMQPEYVTQAINSYLELTEHDNDRYSGISSRVTRRLEQLNKVAQLLLPKGQVDQALTYLGMRQSGFAQGFDRANDWVGSWALESIQSNPDRKSAYVTLADWTFQGDGPLMTIQSLVRRQRLPNWIPESVGGSYPVFPPTADAMLPIATNFYSLARLAQLADATDDLTKRLDKARAAGRAGADIATAICLTTMKQPVSEELLSAIAQRLDAIQPGDGKPDAAAPLAEMQLASMLVNDPAHQDFAKKTTQSLLGHTHRKSRGYLAPWISRYQHIHGWTDTSTLQSADDLSHWMRSTLSSGKDYSEGKTPPIWVTDGASRIDHVCGFGNDYLWFRYPMGGNFTFEFETQDGGWKESELVCDGLRFSALGNSGSVYIKTQNSSEWVRYYSKAPKKNEWNRCSVTLDDEFLSYRVNDVLVYREPRRNRASWVALHSEGNKTTSVRNIKVSGQPEIPRQVDLIPDGDLRGWSGQYYGAKLPAAGINLEKHEAEGNKPQRYRSLPNPDQIQDLAWTVKGGEIISGESKQQNFNGQNSLRYERPLGDGESISYEFYYEEGKVEAHPSIGRIAYVLRPGGLHLHWMSAPNTSWSIPKGFEVPLPDAEGSPLPLNSGQWNRVQLKRTGNNLQIMLNDEVVFDREPQTRLGDMVFGFFHNREQTTARIRNVVLRGPWPDQVPADLLGF